MMKQNGLQYEEIRKLMSIITKKEAEIIEEKKIECCEVEEKKIELIEEIKSSCLPQQKKMLK